MRESNEQLIRIELEEATASVIEDVLKYVYTGNVSVTEESGHNLIATADYLLLPGLKTAACDFLKENVTIENCVFTYYFAEKYQCVDLKERCCEVINYNFSDVVETEDFLNLDEKQVMEWVSTRRKPADLFSVCYRSASKYAADLQMIRRFSADHLQNICRMSAECLQNICRMSANCLNLQNICSSALETADVLQTWMGILQIKSRQNAPMK